MAGFFLAYLLARLLAHLLSSLTWHTFMRTHKFASTFAGGRRQAGMTLLRLMLLLGTIGIVLMVAARLWLKH